MLFLYFLFLIYVKTAICRIYVFNMSQDSSSEETNHSRHLKIYPSTTQRSPTQDIIEKLIIIYQKDQMIAETKRNKCYRNFGSMFGTKTQRLLCIENIRKEKSSERIRKEKSDLIHDNKKKYQNNNQKQISDDYIDLNDFDYRANINDSFSIDDLGVNDLREMKLRYTVEPNDYFKYVFVKTTPFDPNRKSPKCYGCGYNMRKSTKRRKKPVSSEEYIRYKKYKKSRKPKRFEVVSAKDVSDEEYKKRKNINDDEMVLQGGNKIIDIVATDFGEPRRRLPLFLPKRYHWTPEQMHNLGYYWFNGQRGQYPAPTATKTYF